MRRKGSSSGEAGYAQRGRTATDGINGLVAAQGEEVGIPTPTYVVKRAKLGEIEVYLRHVESL
jgi:hypothetical protein